MLATLPAEPDWSDDETTPFSDQYPVRYNQSDHHQIPQKQLQTEEEIRKLKVILKHLKQMLEESKVRGPLILEAIEETIKMISICNTQFSIEKG